MMTGGMAVDDFSIVPNRSRTAAMHSTAPRGEQLLVRWWTEGEVGEAAKKKIALKKHRQN